MQCPVCQDSTLVMSERQGIEIDYCPKCRGVWLDRGELDKIIERARDALPPSEPAARAVAHDSHHASRGSHHAGHRDTGYAHKRRKSFWEDLFD